MSICYFVPAAMRWWSEEIALGVADRCGLSDVARTTFANKVANALIQQNDFELVKRLRLDMDEADRFVIQQILGLEGG